MNRTEAIDIFRDNILLALDDSAKVVFKEESSAIENFKGKEGSLDSDLTSIFDFIDKHFEILEKRYNKTFK